VPSTYKIAVVGSGPAGLSAAARAAELGVSHVLLEAEPHLSNTIHRYQKGKHVMAEPGVLPLRASVPFEAGKRENILGAWNDGAARLKVNLRHRSPVKSIKGSRGAFTLEIAGGEPVIAETVVLAIGLQGNLRKLGAPGEDLDFVQYQLDDPDAYKGEAIVVVGAGDAAIENAIALSTHNQVTIINRGAEFNRAKDANEADILAAIEKGKIRCYYNSAIAEVLVTPNTSTRGQLQLKTAEGTAVVPVDRVIARLGATPPRSFVEGCGVQFPSKDPNCVPAVSGTYESNVPGLFIIGALAGFPLIKQAMNQGYEVIESIEGRKIEPADAPLLRQKFAALPGFDGDVDKALVALKTRMPLLMPLTALQLREFLLDSHIRAPKPGEVIFRRNDYSDSFYSVLAGTVEVEIDPDDRAKRASIPAGQFFGEMSLISGRRRASTVLAGDKCLLVESPRRTTLKLISSVAEVRRIVDEAFLLRSIETQLAQGISPADLRVLAGAATVQSYEPNETLFKEGEPGDALYLIRRGSVTVSRLVAGREVVLAYAPAGQYVGEMALLSDMPRSATVRAAVRTEAIRLEGAVFEQMMRRYPELDRRVREVYRSRLTSNVQQQAAPATGGVISFLMKQGLGEATDVLLIDESLCVRCDQCEKACAATHGNLSRLDREAGPTFDNLHVPTSCRHCEHPHCMKDCPPDAIRRSPGGEVYITDACIGCGNCQRNCPYGVIQMGVESKSEPSLWRWMMFGGKEPGHGDSHEKGAKKAAKCDMCKNLPAGPACVRACPTGAALRVSPEKFMQVRAEQDAT
jgi:CRP-like cAMP-binding protein/thioredoxin reductase/Pyruvate/2-oxoacid:ferredoxin oxidoreductase delta subunit